MDLFFLFSKYFWLLCIGTTFINFLWMDRRVDEADQGVDRALRRQYLAWMWGLQCLPWLVIGIGQLAGGVPSVWAVFRPQDGNPWIWAFSHALTSGERRRDA